MVAATARIPLAGTQVMLLVSALSVLGTMAYRMMLPSLTYAKHG
jgi:hypothetical protein